MVRSPVIEAAAQQDRLHEELTPGNPTPGNPTQPDPAGLGHGDLPSPLDVEVLLRFFDAHGRDLPWRDPTASPWAVLVSEVMLQQTPVARVLPVFDAWLQRWPRPVDLAADSPADAIRAWGRLGYPRRAMRLHAAATAISIDHGGIVPNTVEDLLRLPGIGEYTARAVAAFAFGARTPVVDTNVRRVLSRVIRGLDEPREPSTAADRAEITTLLPDEPARAADLTSVGASSGAGLLAGSRLALARLTSGALAA